MGIGTVRSLVRPLLFALLAVAPTVALVDLENNQLRLDTLGLEVALVTAFVGAIVAAVVTPADRRPLELGMLLAMMAALPAAGAIAAHAVCTGPTMTAILPLDAAWLLTSGATYIGTTMFLLADRRLGFLWWPLALLAASLVAYGQIDFQNPCFPDE